MSSTGMPTIIGAFAILLGLLSIFARDFVWSWGEMMDEFWGKRVERTDLWDFWTILRGLFLICFGLYMIAEH
jgi:hypothetical protein